MPAWLPLAASRTLPLYGRELPSGSLPTAFAQTQSRAKACLPPWATTFLAWHPRCILVLRLPLERARPKDPQSPFGLESQAGLRALRGPAALRGAELGLRCRPYGRSQGLPRRSGLAAAQGTASAGPALHAWRVLEPTKQAFGLLSAPPALGRCRGAVPCRALGPGRGCRANALGHRRHAVPARRAGPSPVALRAREHALQPAAGLSPKHPPAGYSQLGWHALDSTRRAGLSAGLALQSPWGRGQRSSLGLPAILPAIGQQQLQGGQRPRSGR